jgi:hypothetical protein
MSGDLTNQVLGKSAQGTGQRAEAKGRYFVVNLSCSCGWRGTATHSADKPKFLGDGSKGHIYFECPGCRRVVQYHCWSAASKTRGYIWSLMHRIFI